METISRWLLTFLFNSAWQTGLIAALAWLVCRTQRQAPARYRHAIWVLALLASLLLPLLSIRSGESGRAAIPVPGPALETGATAGAPASGAAGRFQAHATDAPGARTVQVNRRISQALLAAYLLFLAYRLARLIVSWVGAARIRRKAAIAEAPPLPAAIWRRAQAAFDLPHARLLVSGEVSGPVTAGAVRPAVILPLSMMQEASGDVLATAIGHEMAHIARRDFALNLIYELLSIPLAFHPALRMIRRGIQSTREMACDEMVAARFLDPAVYAESIMSIAAGQAGLMPRYLLGVLDGDDLEERIRRLVLRRGMTLRRARALLTAGVAILAGCAAIAAGFAISARAQSPATAELQRGAEAYNRGDFQAAAAFFQQASGEDPDSLNARLFWAGTLLREYMGQSRDREMYQHRIRIWSGEIPEDSPLMLQARQIYRDVLARDPNNEGAIYGLASLPGLDGARETRELVARLLARNPENKNAYYTLGMLDWMLSYPEIERAKRSLGIPPQEPRVTDAGVRKDLRERVMPQLQEGREMMERALARNPNWSDAMAYTNLLYRAQAAIVESDQESQYLLAEADEWVQKALAARRQFGSAANSTGSIDAAGPAPLMIPAPPPPPPPPPRH